MTTKVPVEDADWLIITTFFAGMVWGSHTFTDPAFGGIVGGLLVVAGWMMKWLSWLDLYRGGYVSGDDE